MKQYSKTKSNITCERCSYQWNTRSLKEFVSCPSCLKKTKNTSEKAMRKRLKAIAQQKGLLWCKAAMIEGSIGYHSPKSAQIRIEALLEDRQIMTCERCSACFNNNPLEELDYDFRLFQIIEKDNPEKAKRILEFTKKLINMSDDAQTSIGLMYPTMRI